MLTIALFELRRRLKMLSTWVYFGIFFVLACLAMNAAGGAFKSVVFSAGGGGKVLANSPFTLTSMSTLLGFAGVIITGGVIGQADLKEPVKNVYFLVIVLAGVIFVLGSSRIIEKL